MEPNVEQTVRVVTTGACTSDCITDTGGDVGFRLTFKSGTIIAQILTLGALTALICIMTLYVPSLVPAIPAVNTSKLAQDLVVILR
jgi:hypothetical protein